MFGSFILPQRNIMLVSRPAGHVACRPAAEWPSSDGPRRRSHRAREWPHPCGQSRRGIHAAVGQRPASPPPPARRHPCRCRNARVHAREWPHPCGRQEARVLLARRRPAAGRAKPRRSPVPGSLHSLAARVPSAWLARGCRVVAGNEVNRVSGRALLPLRPAVPRRCRCGRRRKRHLC